MPVAFVMLGWLFILVLVMLFAMFTVGYYTLTAVELIAGILILVWITLFIRSAAAIRRGLAKKLARHRCFAVSKEWKRGRALKRVRPGNGRALARFRWWHLFGRALFHLRFYDSDGRPVTYSVDIPNKRNAGYDDGKAKAHLYLDGIHRAESKMPAAFPTHDGTIEVATSMYGVKRCHFVTVDGEARQLSPDPKSAEGRRARLDRDHPAMSRVLGFLSVAFLVAGTVLLLVQLAEPISAIPPIAQRIGAFDSPIHLPLWLNVGLGFGALAGSTDRALRLRHSWLDSAGN